MTSEAEKLQKNILLEENKEEKNKNLQRLLTVTEAYTTYKHTESEDVLSFANFVLEDEPKQKNPKQKNKKTERKETINKLCKYARSLYKKNPATSDESFKNCQYYYEEIQENDILFYPFSVKDKIDNNVDSSNLMNVLEQDSQQKNSVEKAKEAGAVNAFALNYIINPPYRVAISDETLCQISSASEGAHRICQISSANEGEGVSDYLNKREYIGLTTASQILRLYRKVYDLPDTMTYFPQGSSVQNYENMQNHQKASGLSDESFAKNLNIPRGFPSVIMTFGDFKNWKALTKLLKVPPIPKVPANRDQFKKDLNQAEADFFNEKGRNALTERIVFEVKQAIARFHGNPKGYNQGLCC